MATEDQHDIYTDGGVREDLLNRRKGGAKVFYIHRYQVEHFLLFRIFLVAIWGCSSMGLAQSGCV